MPEMTMKYDHFKTANVRSSEHREWTRVIPVNRFQGDSLVYFTCIKRSKRAAADVPNHGPPLAIFSKSVLFTLEVNNMKANCCTATQEQAIT